jgi:hypothetical protein
MSNSSIKKKILDRALSYRIGGEGAFFAFERDMRRDMGALEAIPYHFVKEMDEFLESLRVASFAYEEGCIDQQGEKILSQMREWAQKLPE